MITKYVCQICNFSSENQEEVAACEARDHGINLNGQFTSLSNDDIASFRPRMDAIGKMDKKPLLDSPCMAVRSALYELYADKKYTVLSAALIEIERLYAKS